MLEWVQMYGAIDIGGTKTLIAVFDKDGNIIEQVKFPTPKDYSDFGKELAATVEKLSTKEFKRAAVAIPGRPDRKRGIGLAFGNLPWENVPIQADVEKIFNCPAAIENDAKLAALSEAINLNGEYKKVLYATISTGIGGGLVINEHIDPHFHDMEMGHMLLEHDGQLERWEEFASGSAIYKKFGKKASDIPEEDTQAWYTIARNIAIGLIAVIATLTPDVIVIGGGVGTHLPKFKKQLDEHLKIYENPMLTIPPVVQAKHPEEAVIYGCYELAKRHHGQRTATA